jgi:hypothetical protein
MDGWLFFFDYTVKILTYKNVNKLHFINIKTIDLYTQ